MGENNSSQFSILKRQPKQINKQPGQKWAEDLSWHFSKEDVPMANTHMKRCSTSLIIQFSSLSHSVVFDSLRLHESQHARPPCPPPTPGDHSNSCPLSHWRRPTISSSVIPFSSCLQSSLASRSFPVSQLFASGGPSTGASAFSPCNEYSRLISFRIDWFPLGSPCSPRDSQESSPAPQF